jgi:hypothetical protein
MNNGEWIGCGGDNRPKGRRKGVNGVDDEVGGGGEGVDEWKGDTKSQSQMRRKGERSGRFVGMVGKEGKVPRRRTGRMDCTPREMACQCAKCHYQFPSPKNIKTPM